MHEILKKEIKELISTDSDVGFEEAPAPIQSKPVRQEPKSVKEEYMENLQLAAEGNEIINVVTSVNLMLLMAGFYFVIERLL